MGLCRGEHAEVGKKWLTFLFSKGESKEITAFIKLAADIETDT